MNQNNIGKFILKLRKESKMTQQELADKLNVTDRAVSNWENGRRIPDISLYKLICDVFDITVSELINGERMTKDKIISSSDNTIINTLNKSEKNKKVSSLIIKILLCLLAIIIILFMSYYKELYPKIDIYNLSISLNEATEDYKLGYFMTFDNKDIYTYGIDRVEVCDVNENCYKLKESLLHNQTSIDKIKSHLEREFVLSNIDRYMLWDGGTTIYKNSGMSVIFCNTIDKNNDIYIGASDMVDALDGGYCGHKSSTTKKFIRTYKVKSEHLLNDNEFMSVTLEDENGNKGNVKIHISHNIVVGRTYEFSFFTYEKFKDTIENIFKYSTFLEAKEIDENESEHINEEIVVNSYLESNVDLNELENVVMKIKKGSLTSKSATVVINDLSGKNYIYGDEFRIDKKENGEWTLVKTLGNNYGFNAIAYHVDINGNLELECNWEYIYGPLEKGEYRIVKYVFTGSNKPVTNIDKKYFSVEFMIK